MKAQIMHSAHGNIVLSLFHENQADRDALQELVNLHARGFMWEFSSSLNISGKYGPASVALVSKKVK